MMASSAEGPRPTRKRSWGEHPLSIPANLSWATLGITIGALLLIADLPAAAWTVPVLWSLGNVTLSVYLLKTREIPIVNRDPAIRGTSLFGDAMRRLRRNQMAVASIGILALMVLLCFSQQLIYGLTAKTPRAAEPDSFFSLHLDHERQNTDEVFSPPSSRHWFGTDPLGRDLFARCLYGGQISFMVALLATIVSLAIGVTWGAVAGYFGGRIDHYMMRVVDIIYGLPFMFLVILILSLLRGLDQVAAENQQSVHEYWRLIESGQPGEAENHATTNEITFSVRAAVFLGEHVEKTYAMFVCLGLVSWLTMARITRGQVLSLREREFVTAARTLGASNARIILLHIIPNLLGPVIIYTTLTIPTVMLAEAFLSFLGVGISEPQCSWGSLASVGVNELSVIKPYWWLLAYPAAAMFVSLFSLNFIGDGLRDAFDPKGRR